MKFYRICCILRPPGIKTSISFLEFQRVLIVLVLYSSASVIYCMHHLNAWYQSNLSNFTSSWRFGFETSTSISLRYHVGQEGPCFLHTSYSTYVSHSVDVLLFFQFLSFFPKNQHPQTVNLLCAYLRHLRK